MLTRKKGNSLVSRVLEEVVPPSAPMVSIHTQVRVAVVITSHHRNTGGHEGKQVRPTSNILRLNGPTDPLLS
jgi:hypothetical protein